MHKEDRKERIQGQHLCYRETSTTEDHTKISHREDEKKQHNEKSLTGKVLQPKTTDWYRTEKIEKKQHKVKYVRAKVPQLKTTERLQAERIENKQHKAKYLTGKVPQPKTTEIYPAENIEKKQHKINYLTGKIPKPETEKFILQREENERKNNTKIYRR